MKFGLHGIKTLLKFLDNPERKFQTIHIAGTNGKGSTASMIASIFTAAGYKTGLYTSPHLVHFNERIRINGKSISQRQVQRLISIIQPEVDKNKSTFFEAVTAIAFKYFAESKVDIAIIETGLGGRLDATNVITPLASVITSIGLEHTQILGNSIKKIAYEKGGIIKRNVPCVSGVKSKAAFGILREICTKEKSELVRICTKDVRIRKYSLDGSIIDVFFAGKNIKNVKVSLAGEHQVINALLSIKTLEMVSELSDFKFNPKVISDGLKKIQQYSGLQARMSVIHRNPLIIVDVAHNPDAIHTLCVSLKGMHRNKFRIVIGLMKDKNYKQIIAELKKVCEDAIVVAAKTKRSRSTKDLAKEFKRFGVEALEFPNVNSGIKEALKQKTSASILITGSHFVVGEAIALLNREKYLTINQ